MATDNTIVSYFTNAGQALATEVQAGTTKLTFTKAEASNTNHSSDSTDTLAQITALDSVKQTAEIGAVLILNKNTVQVSIDFNQNEITDDYDLWTIGLFAKSDTDDEILYSVTPLEHSQYMYSDTSGSTLTINLNTAVEQAASVNLVVGQADSVTSAQLTATLQSYDTSAQVNDKIAAIPKPDLSNYTTVTDLNNGLSTKVTDNKDGTEQLNGVQIQPFNKLSDTIGGRNLIVAKTIENNTTLDPKGVSFRYLTCFVTDYIPVVANQKYTITVYGTTIPYTSRISYYNSSKNFISRENDRKISASSSEVIVVPSGISYIKFSPDTPDKSGKYEDNYKLEQGSIATDWTPAPEDKVNVTDMRKPASDVAGIEEVNAKQDKIGYTPADDSKVAHLSGANNFDTVPTVNNNPLLLASSLPSDLARTGSDQEFTGKNTFDTAPIDKTTGNPYITKSDLSGYVTLAALQTILADYIKVDPNTGYVDHTIKVHYGNLTIDDDVVGVNKWVLDEDTAIAQTAIYPANNYYVSDDTTTGGAS